MTHLQSANVMCSPGTSNTASPVFGGPPGGILHSGGNMPSHLEQQQATAAQMLRQPHLTAHHRQQHHQGAQPQRQLQARQMGAGQAQRPEAARAPAAAPASGPGPSYLGSAPVSFIRQPMEQGLDSPEGEWPPLAGHFCPGCMLCAGMHVWSSMLQMHQHGRGCSLPSGATLSSSWAWCCATIRHSAHTPLFTFWKQLADRHTPACFDLS